jgi:cytochrome c5
MKRWSIIIIFVLFPWFCFGLEDPMSPEAIESRIEPVGKEKITQEASPPPTQPTATQAAARPVEVGESTYKQYCHVCHEAGVAGAPKAGTDEWKPRAAKGIDQLLISANKGLNAMPPKGTCMTCSDNDLKAAILFMMKKK